MSKNSATPSLGALRGFVLEHSGHDQVWHYPDCEAQTLNDAVMQLTQSAYPGPGYHVYTDLFYAIPRVVA